MQSATFTLSPSLRLPKPRRLSSATLNPRFDPICTSASLKPNNLTPQTNGTLSASLPRRSWSLSSSSSNFKLRPWTSVPLVDSDAGTSRFEVRATAESAEESSESSSMFKTLELGALFGLWYLFNIYFNIYNKQVLKVFPYPVTVTGIQFAVGTVLVLLMWGLNLYKKPKVSGAQLAAILPLAVVHTLGNLFTNMSLGKVAVSFTHTIKASEPFFSVILSAMFLGEIPTPWVVASLIPIVGGVGLASVTEASFNWAGFWSAMASNLTNQSRNVLWCGLSATLWCGFYFPLISFSLVCFFSSHVGTDRLSLMHGGGLLPRIHALQISFVGSHGPSSTGSDSRSGGSSGGCLVLGWDFRVARLRVFVVLYLKYVYFG